MPVELEREKLTLYRLQRPAVLASPWAFYAYLQDVAPIQRDPYLRCWTVARHRDVVALLADPRLSVAMDHAAQAARLPAGERVLRRAMALLDDHVSFVDAPAHPRLRKGLAAPFAPRHVTAMDDEVRAIVDDAVAAVRGRARPDLVADLASRVPLLVIRQLLGLDDVSLADLHRWSTAWGAVVAAPGHIPTGDRAAVMADVAELIARLERLVATMARGPVSPTLAHIAAFGQLSDEELLANLMMLVTAGNETTANLIANAVLALAERPDLWQRLAGDRSLLPAAIEEIARVHPPTQYTARIAREAIELDGHTIPAGASVVLLLAAANRDPSVFDEPSEIRVDRPNARRHVAFGHGAHFCFGAPLARLETRLVLDRLLDGGPPVLDGAPVWRMNANLRGLASLPARWSPIPSTNTAGSRA